jgi:hypothetical protein
MNQSVSRDDLARGLSLDCLSECHDTLPPILVGVGDCLGRENSTSRVLERRCVPVVGC